MAQQKIWEDEYRNPRLVTGTGLEPIADVERFIKWLRKKQPHIVEALRGKTLKVLDLGSGNGKNGNYLARLGAEVMGIDIASNIVALANKTARELELSASYSQGSIGEKLPFDEQEFDMALDVTASNSLNEAERKVYLDEVSRVLRPGGYFFVRALTKDGDKNAKNLLKLYPGKELDTYVMPEVGLVERVWSEVDFRQYYEQFFTIVFLEKREHYTRIGTQKYKRNFIIAYLVKK